MDFSEVKNAEEGRVEYYVSVTWDDWPEGGSYTNSVMAKDDEDAVWQIKMEMAASRADARSLCVHCGEDADNGEGHDGFCGDCADRNENGEALEETQAAELKVYHELAESWHVVNCIPNIAKSVYPKQHSDSIYQYDDHVFVWYNEVGMIGGASETLQGASERMAAYARSLDAAPDPTNHVAVAARVVADFVDSNMFDVNMALGEVSSKHNGDTPFRHMLSAWVLAAGAVAGQKLSPKGAEE